MYMSNMVFANNENMFLKTWCVSRHPFYTTDPQFYHNISLKNTPEDTLNFLLKRCYGKGTRSSPAC